MTIRALLAIAGFVGLCHSLPAQQVQGSGPLQFEGGTLNRPFLPVPSLSLVDQERVSFMTAFSWQTPLEFLPPFHPVEPLSVSYPTRPSRVREIDDVVELRGSDRIYAGGEVGFFYGKSSGKYGREDFQTYIIGTVGNEKFSITAGILHQESSGRAPRWRR